MFAFECVWRLAPPRGMLNGRGLFAKLPLVRARSFIPQHLCLPTPYLDHSIREASREALSGQSDY